MGGDVRVYTLSNIISFFNADDVNDSERQRVNFEKATNLAADIIDKKINDAAKFIENRKKFNSLLEVLGEEIYYLPEPVRWNELLHEKKPNAQFMICPSFHPENKFSLTAVTIHPNSRETKTPIERPDFFEGFIHQGKWIAGANDVETLVKLAKWNLKNKI